MNIPKSSVYQPERLQLAGVDEISAASRVAGLGLVFDAIRGFRAGVPSGAVSSESFDSKSEHMTLLRGLVEMNDIYSSLQEVSEYSVDQRDESQKLSADPLANPKHKVLHELGLVDVKIGLAHEDVLVVDKATVFALSCTRYNYHSGKLGNERLQSDIVGWAAEARMAFDMSYPDITEKYRKIGRSLIEGGDDRVERAVNRFFEETDKANADLRYRVYDIVTWDLASREELARAGKVS